MKIVVVSTPVFKVPLSGYGGLEMIAWQTAKGLAERGHQVSLVAPDGSECPGVDIIPVGPEMRVDELMAYGGFGEMKDQNGTKVRDAHPGYWQKLLDCDVCIDHTWNKWSYQIKAEGRMKASILGVFHAPVNTMYQTWPPQFPGLPTVERACPVCISQDQANHFEALFSPYPARVVRNGVDHTFYKPLGVPRSDRFLFLARFSTIKGPDIALEVCYEAGVGLDLVGDTTITNEPGFLDHCKALADRQSPGWDPDRGKQFRIVGGVSRGECVYWMSQAFCMLHLNQKFREPLGLAPIESMLCECPVLGWRYGALPETVGLGDRDSWWLVKSKEEAVEKVKHLSRNPMDNVARSVFRSNALQFSVEAMVSGYEKLCLEATETEGW